MFRKQMFVFRKLFGNKIKETPNRLGQNNQKFNQYYLTQRATWMVRQAMNLDDCSWLSQIYRKWKLQLIPHELYLSYFHVL